jgi:acyl carrier protein
MPHPIEQQISKFIRENFLFRDDRAEIPVNESLMDAGLIDSTGVLELVAFLEGTFNIRMADADIVPANLDTIRGITDYVVRKQTAVAA